MALLQVVSVAVQFALAVWAWGGWTAFFAHPALRALVWVSVAMLIAAMFTSGNVSTGEREDRGNRWVLWAFTGLALLTAYLPAYTDRRDLWSFGGDAVRWVGVAMFLAGCVLRLWPVFVLGNRFSGLVAIQPGHTLVTGGIYRTIRNPSYLGMLIAVPGWALAFRSVVGLVLTALLLVPLVARMNAEEKMLRSQFAAEYDAYRARTWRLFPGIY